jgi:hypothetical protein
MSPNNNGYQNIYNQFKFAYTEYWNDGHCNMEGIPNNNVLIPLAKTLVKNYSIECCENYPSFKLCYESYKFDNNGEPTRYDFIYAPCAWSSFVMSIMMYEFH